MKALKLVSMSVLLASLATGSMVVHADDTAQDGTLKRMDRFNIVKRMRTTAKQLIQTQDQKKSSYLPTQEGCCNCIRWRL